MEETPVVAKCPPAKWHQCRARASDLIDRPPKNDLDPTKLPAMPSGLGELYLCSACSYFLTGAPSILGNGACGMPVDYFCGYLGAHLYSFNIHVDYGGLYMSNDGYDRYGVERVGHVKHLHVSF